MSLNLELERARSQKWSPILEFVTVTSVQAALRHSERLLVQKYYLCYQKVTALSLTPFLSMFAYPQQIVSPNEQRFDPRHGFRWKGARRCLW